MPVRADEEVRVPNWRSVEALYKDGFDENGNLVTQSAESVGLGLNIISVPNPGHIHGGGYEDDIIILSPSAGTLVSRGTVVTAVIWDRDPDEDVP
jgi:hypothetical protein